MIKNKWYAILSSREVKKGKLTGVKRLGEQLVFFRNTQGDIQCIADKCCHRGASIAAGWHCGDTVACPFHGIEYDGMGRVTKIPANGKNTPVPDYYQVSAYPVQEAHDLIWLWYGDDEPTTFELPFFNELEGMTFSEIRDPWDTHYSRCIENQLDAVHVPFVHHNTIGRGNKTLVDGPKVIYDDDTLTFYVHNEVDDGRTIPLRPDAEVDYKKWFSLQFRYPNIWQNRISPLMRVFAAFAPIDKEHTMVYVRYYQRLIRAPLLHKAVDLSGKLFSKIVLNQDRRVVETQRPLKSEYVMDEHLIPGDSPIIEYRRIREELKQGTPPQK
ncbi:aromatic ring-hydroxylating oxygenase subunit alpha [Eubacterium aggregans]|uniref:aromatic ring-hydroxylating oxygenase subunit alpha n=1 Tax=Eubacterium aggregans TaxID=81409 RepID=UPI0023F0B453|nr:aromatic ring-hydroxylating dioxygenase subunit alpha [Eubacterium aggregans]MDD4692210.1 aromatic ring-hydroxylating dioxygenase subunit alpha [Eubacterium aggregans]